MNKKEFQKLLQGVNELGETLRGSKRHIARVDHIEPDSVIAIRAKLGLSQAKFAHVFGISVDTLQNWEQGRRRPSGAARVLLKVAKKHPDAILEAVA